jgi:hypothetical protein
MQTLNKVTANAVSRTLSKGIYSRSTSRKGMVRGMLQVTDGYKVETGKKTGRVFVSYVFNMIGDSRSAGFDYNTARVAKLNNIANELIAAGYEIENNGSVVVVIA